MGWNMRNLEDLMDDGENQAVRSFLLVFGKPGLTVGGMRRHMELSGWPHWPDWVFSEDVQPLPLTKHGAQHWLRHLFALEGEKQ